MNPRGPGSAARQRGSIVEALLALPILMAMAGAALQFGLLYHARQGLQHALMEAGRAASVAHATPEAIREGLARGLVPWLHGATDFDGQVRATVQAASHVSEGEARGWLRIARVSPSPASFEDWGVAALDEGGEPIAGVVEIPNDGLRYRAVRMQPAGGAIDYRGREPIGRASGQTLADANLLRLRLDYGVPLQVPVVGRLIAWSLRAWYGCGARMQRQLGLLRLDLGTDVQGGTPDRAALACALLGADDDPGARPRLPVRLVVTLRMQSPARRSDAPASPPGGAAAEYPPLLPAAPVAAPGESGGPGSPSPGVTPVARPASGPSPGITPVTDATPLPRTPVTSGLLPRGAANDPAFCLAAGA